MITSEAVTQNAFDERKSLRHIIDTLVESQAKTLLRRAITLTAQSDRDRENWRALIG